MALTEIERIRNKTGDKAVLRRERNVGDGIAEHFKLSFEPIQAVPAPEIWVDDVIQVENTDYIVNYDQGIISFISAPTSDQKLVFQYYSVVWTDAEMQDYLDQYASNINISSAHILLAWAADIGKVARRETRQGGGGMGSITIDTSVASKELRATAEALLKYELEYGEEAGAQVAAESLTEIPWTEQSYQDIAYQRFIREN